jgi:hypothetical protein
MLKTLLNSGLMLISVIFVTACSESDTMSPQTLQNEPIFQTNSSQANARMGVSTANGWYEGEEIYYIDLGVEEGVTARGSNQIYLIGGNRMYQAQVVKLIPGEAGYTPHWNVNVVHTAEGKTLTDILSSPYASEHFGAEGVLFDDVEDILDAADAGLVIIVHPGVVVNCPIISEQGADAPGNMALSEDFPPFPETF